MRLQEIVENFDHEGYRNEMFSNVHSFMEYINVDRSQYFLTDGKIDVLTDVHININSLPDGKLPFAFGTIRGDFHVRGRALTSMENCPAEVLGDFSWDETGITSLEGGPKHVSGMYSVRHTPNLVSLKGMPEKIISMLDLTDCGKLSDLTGIAKDVNNVNLRKTAIKSFVGIQNHIDVLRGFIRAPWDDVTEGGLGLVKIGGKNSYLSALSPRHVSPFLIISNYMGRPDDIFECQSELIEHGFEEYAKL